MRRHWTLWVPFFFANSMSAVAGAGVVSWAPAYGMRRFDESDVALTAILGAMTSAGSLLGSVGGGVFAQAMINIGRSRLLPVVQVALTLLGSICFALFPYAGSWTAATVGMGLGSAMNGAMYVLGYVAVQEAAPNHVRSQLFGLWCGLAFVPGVVGPTLVALCAEKLFAHSGGLGPAFTLVSALTSFFGCGLFLLSLRPYQRAMEEVATPSS
jgi:MFS family permease